MTVLDAPRHRITRSRREPQRRSLTVTAVERLTPKMQRIGFASPDLHDFASDAPDDHIKLFFDDGVSGRCMRDYTPRRFDPALGTLTIDFALHQAGPATAWALDARIGDQLDIGGPRGSTIIPDDFDWYLLIGDETALPAIGRRIEELRPGVPVISIVAVDGDGERQEFATRADWMPRWVFRANASDDAALLRRSLARITLPRGDGFVWIAAEANVARDLKDEIIDRLGHPPAWLKSSGYWTRGAAQE